MLCSDHLETHGYNYDLLVIGGGSGGLACAKEGRESMLIYQFIICDARPSAVLQFEQLNTSLLVLLFGKFIQKLSRRLLLLDTKFHLP